VGARDARAGPRPMIFAHSMLAGRRTSLGPRARRSSDCRGTTDLPVVLPYRLHRDEPPALSRCIFTPAMALALLACLGVSVVLTPAFAQGQVQAQRGILETLWKWTPLLFWGPTGEIGGFVLNVLVSFLAMAVGTLLGLGLGLMQVSPRRQMARLAWWITQVFRNSPWLVLLFYVMLLVPFQVTLFGQAIPLPGWLKAALALALPIMANLSEIVRGAINSIGTGQWDAAESLGFKRRQIMWMIILPQCMQRMTPPWMNWYQILAMATPLISILGVNDCLRLVRDALAAEGRSEYLIPMYLWIMLWFFAYCYPIARWTIRLERKWAVVA
jgi:polar amino acid transport system permease protein